MGASLNRCTSVLFALLFSAVPALAQIVPSAGGEPCHFVSVYGAVATAGQWTACIDSLEPVINYTPVNQAGDTMQGPLGVTQLFGAGGHPTVAAGAGAGTSPTVSLSGSPHDSAFQLNVTTGSAPTGSNAVIATVTFAANYSQNPTCTFSAHENDAASLAAAAHPFGAGAAGPPSTWTLTSGATALAASTTYKWDVICQG